MQAQAKSPFEQPLARVAFIVSLSFHNSTGLPQLQDYDPGKYGDFNVYLQSWRPLSELTWAVFSLAIYLGLALSFYIVLLGSPFFQQLVWHWKASRACNLNQPMQNEYCDYLI
jgi:Ni/Fe-hydrogenase subunit HybB-like protein